MSDTREEVERLRQELHRSIRLRLLDIIEERGVNRSELSRRMETSRSYVSNALNGRTRLNVDGCVRVAHALGLRLKVDIVDEEELDQVDESEVVDEDDKANRAKPRICRKIRKVWEDHYPELTFGRLIAFLKPVGVPMASLEDRVFEHVLDAYLLERKHGRP